MYMKSDLIQAHGEWLKSFQYNWFATFTFDRPVKDYAVRRAMNEYFERLAAVSGNDPFAFWVPERGKWDSKLHVHALIGNVGWLPGRCRLPGHRCLGCGYHLWRSGFRDVKNYNSDLEGAFYMLKSLKYGKAELEILGNPVAGLHPYQIN